METFLNEDTVNLLSVWNFRVEEAKNNIIKNNDFLSKKQYAVLSEIEKMKEKGICIDKIKKNLNFKDSSRLKLIITALILKGLIFSINKNKKIHIRDGNEIILENYPKYFFIARKFADKNIEFDIPIWWHQI